jgi:UDP-N-acetylglucosamine acyltransferase
VSVHPTAVVASSAVVPASCTVGPYCTIGPDVVLGEDCELISHVILDGHTTIGARNKFFPFASIGVEPQDISYAGQPTRLEMGDENVVRESVTISRGTVKGGGITRVGSFCLFMTCAHVGHDSQVGDHCIMANSATLAGHVIVEEWTTVGAFSAVHQFCFVGRYAFIGGGTICTQDVLPYSLTASRREARAYGINKIGLQRRGFSKERIKALQHAYRTLLASKLNTAQAMARLRAEGTSTDDVAYLIECVERSTRGVIK